MKKILILTILTLTIFYISTPVFAQEENIPTLPKSPRARLATPTPEDDRQDEIKKRVQNRLENIKEANKKRAFWGTISNISSTSLTINSLGTTRTIKLSDETKITLDKKDSEWTDLKVGFFVIVLGSVDSEDNMAAKLIMAYSKVPKPTPARTAIFGKITNISEDENLIDVLGFKKEGLTSKIKVNNSTIITKKIDGSIKKVKFADLAKGDIVVVIGTKPDDTILAKIVHVIPGKASPTPTKTPTTTPKISPKPTPKITPEE